MKTTIYCISDLHLSPHSHTLNQALATFLEKASHDATHLYVLGDLFDLYLGMDVDPDFIEHIRALFCRFQDTSQAKLFFMAGNRDFFLNRKFAHACRGTFIDDPFTTEHFNQKVCFGHGDLLCTDDIDYQKFRRWIRQPWVYVLAMTLPARLRQNIAKKIQAKSRDSKKGKSMAIMDANPEACVALLQETQADLLIHGHTHRPAIHEHEIDGVIKTRWVLADWGKENAYWYLKWTEAGIEQIKQPLNRNA